MIIIKAFIALAILLIIPIFLGLLILNFTKKEEKNILMAFIMGYMVKFALCELLAVPLIFMGKSYNTLLYLYYFVILVLTVISIKLNYKKIKEIIKDNFEKLKKAPKILLVVCVLLIGFQIYEYVFYTHIDDDDAFYVGTATTSIQTNTLYKYSPTTGIENGENMALRYRLGPFSLFVALISSVIMVHPAIVSHVVFPVIFVPIVYIIYYLIGMEFFKNDKKNTLIFLIFLNILQIWGCYSIRTSSTFFLFRIWQGKAVLASMILPLIWLLFIKAEKDNFSFRSCVLLFTVILAGNLPTTMGIALPPITLMLLSIGFELSKINYKKIKENNFKKRIQNILRCLACCTPSIIYGLIYFLY